MLLKFTEENLWGGGKNEEHEIHRGSTLEKDEELASRGGDRFGKV